MVNRKWRSAWFGLEKRTNHCKQNGCSVGCIHTYLVINVTKSRWIWMLVQSLLALWHKFHRESLPLLCLRGPVQGTHVPVWKCSYFSWRCYWKFSLAVVARNHFGKEVPWNWGWSCSVWRWMPVTHSDGHECTGRQRMSAASSGNCPVLLTSLPGLQKSLCPLVKIVHNEEDQTLLGTQFY